MISIDKYIKYDYLFKNVVPDPHLKIKIFGDDDSYLKPQDYNTVTNLENKIWEELYTNLDPLLDQYASREYLLGVRALPIPKDRFPEFDSISSLIENSTEWQLIPVAGFLTEKLFFDLNAKQ